MKQSTINRQLRLGSPVASGASSNSVGSLEDTSQGAAYSLIEQPIRNFKNMACEKTYKVQFNEKWLNERVLSLEDELRGMFNDILQRASNDHGPDDGVRVHIAHPDLRHDIVVPPKRLEDMDADHIMDCVETVAQSERDLPISSQMEIIVGIYQQRGGGAPIDAFEKLTKSHSVIKISNPHDQMCFARALAVGIAGYNKDNPVRAWLVPDEAKLTYNMIRRQDSKEQTVKAAAYQAMAGLTPDRPVKLEDIPKFERALDVTIVVISVPDGYRVIYQSETRYSRVAHMLYIEHEGAGHFHALTNIKGFFGYTHYCYTCLKGSKSKKRHSCRTSCLVCKTDSCVQDGEDKTITCETCNMVCRSQDFYWCHLAKT